MSSVASVRTIALVVMTMVGCAGPGKPLEGPDDAAEHGDASSAAGGSESPPAQARRGTPIHRQPGAEPSEGFEPIEASVVWSCDAYHLRIESGTLFHSQEDLEADFDLEDLGGRYSSWCEGGPPSVDFTEHALVAVVLDFQAAFTHVSARGPTLELGVSHSVYCGGPAPPGPRLVLVEVPASSTEAKVVHQPVQGECTGEPRP